MRTCSDGLALALLSLFTLTRLTTCASVLKQDTTMDDIVVGKSEQLVGIREIHNIANFVDYSDVSLMFFIVPKDVQLLEIAVKAYSRTRSVLFSCRSENITLHLKHGSVPIVSPDESKLPSSFAEITRPNVLTYDLTNDNKYLRINLTKPSAGHLFGVAYINWMNPLKFPISQNGLHAECHTHILAYAKIRNVFTTVTTFQEFHVVGDYVGLFKFDNANSTTQQDVVVNVINESVDSNLSAGQLVIYLGYNNTMPTTEYYYQKFLIAPKSSFVVRNVTNFFLLIKYTPSEATKISNNSKLVINPSRGLINVHFLVNHSDSSNSHPIAHLTKTALKTLEYDFFKLLLYMSDLPITYSYVYNHANFSQPNKLNLTTEITTFKFNVAFEQVGTSLLINASIESDWLNKSSLIGCLNHKVFSLPLLTHECLTFNSSDFVLLNTTVSTRGNITGTILPFPEIGSWFLTLRVVQNKFNGIANANESFGHDLKKCEEFCFLVNKNGDCQGVCARIIDKDKYLKLNISMGKGWSSNTNGVKLNRSVDLENLNYTSVIFSITTPGCVKRDCNDNGYCSRHLTEIGTLMFTCLCRNQWIGWDCSDGRFVQKNYMILVGSVLLIFSNLAFLASIYVAFVRKYYSECLMYTSLMLASMFYHACDSGEDQYRFCLFNSPDVLQFCDFYCGMLSIWMTMIVMADVDQLAEFRSIFYVFGAVVIAFLTEYNKHSLVTFLMPFSIALVLIAFNWFTKYRRTNHIFPPRDYLNNFAIGLALVILALALFGFFETHENYQYVHSLWHVLVASAICFLLPKPEMYRNTNIK